MSLESKDINNINHTDCRWSWIEVNLDSIRRNINKVKSKIGPNVKLLAVVKADAYGHGAVEVAKTAVNCGAAYLATATVYEGIQLRNAGIDAKILVLAQPPAESIPALLKYDIMPAVHSSEFLIQYAEAADRLNKKACYHLAVNTGMNRVGVRHNEVLDFLHSVSFHRALKMEGIFTHFATADHSDQLDFKNQYMFFKELIDNLAQANIDYGLAHCANSATIFRYPEAHFDMVRAGIVIYGLNPSELFENVLDLEPAMSVHAKITDERIIGTGEGVSYGFLYRSKSPVKICTLPIGYADGLHRIATGKIGVIYKGKIFEQVGRICMDMCMFKIPINSSDMQSNYNAQIGDKVTIIGQEGNAKITLDDLAKACGTINYEMATSFGLRMPIVYIH